MQNSQLAGSFVKTYGITKNGSGRRKNAGNRGLEFQAVYVINLAPLRTELARRGGSSHFLAAASSVQRGARSMTHAD